MDNEQNMQPDWAEKLVDDIREGACVDGEIRDKLSYSEACARVRTVFNKQYPPVCSELAKADELRQDVMQERDELRAKLAALETVCAKMKKALELSEPETPLYSEAEKAVQEALTLSPDTIADKIAKLQNESDQLRKALASSCDEERSLAVSEGPWHSGCGLAAELEEKLAAKDAEINLIENDRLAKDSELINAQQRVEEAEAKLADAVFERDACHEIFDNIRRTFGYPDGVGYPMLTGEAKKIMAELKALREATQWRPIETAPKDGTRIVCRYKDNRPYVARLCFDGAWIVDNGGLYRDATQWYPLPPAPDAARGKEAAS